MPYIDRSVLPFDPRLPPRFWEKVEFTTDACWIWTAACMKNGYAVYHPIPSGPRKGEVALAHRVAFEALVGPIMKETIDHLCRVRSCVNPSHMEPVSRGENVLRGISPAAMHARQTHCYRGHPLSGETMSIHKKQNGRTARSCLPCGRIYYHLRRARKLENSLGK